MRKIIILIISSLIISCENMNDNQPAKIVFLGDSITQQAEDFEDGFISIIRQNLVQDKFELVGKGISGNKVSDLLTETIATLGENISINRFIRFAVGENPALSNGQQ